MLNANKHVVNRFISENTRFLSHRDCVDLHSSVFYTCTRIYRLKIFLL
jgi:hypothetical protein